MKAWLERVRPLAVAMAVAVAFGACDEQLNGGIACPALCPSPPSVLRDTTFFAVDLDTAIAGYPSLGSEVRFFVASFGDTLQTAAVFRFDSLPKTFRKIPSADDSTIVFVDTGAHVRLRIVAGDTLGAPTTIEAYNVDLDGAEEADPTALASAFTPDRLLGSRTVPADSLRDSVRVPIDPAFLLSRIQAESLSNRLRIGIRVAQAGNPRLTVVSWDGGGTPQLSFKPSPDSMAPLVITPFSDTPDEFFIASALADYLVVLQAPPPPPAEVFRVGGLPGQRVYLRFNIPASILDSSNVVRATLFMTQRPNAYSPEPSDTVGVGHFGVVAGTAITDLTRTLFFLQRLRNRDTLRVVASDSGLRTFEMIDWVRAWRGTDPLKTRRAMGLATSKEGENAGQVDFFSIEAPASVRPRLRLTYSPRTTGALP